MFIEQMQFGYSTNTIEFVKRLRKQYDVTIYCCDFGRNKVAIEGVNVIYAPQERNGFINALSFRFGIAKLKMRNYDYVFIMYFVGMSLLHLISRKSVKVCNIRTGAIFTSAFRRFVYNVFIMADAMTFKHRAIVSHGLAASLRLKKYHYLPIGANLNCFEGRSFRELNLLYVGVFDHRRIEDTVLGFEIFNKKYGHRVKCTYTIVGDGASEFKKPIIEAISKRNLSHLVSLVGYVQREKVGEYLRKANVGVSYIPIENYYNYQPPTKTFEYLLSGLPVIGTATYENSHVINEMNGVLVKDNPEAFSDGLERLLNNRDKFDSLVIQAAAEKHTWDRIVDQNLCQYLDAL